MNTEKILQHLVGKTYTEVVCKLSTEEEYGDCCGWSGVEINDMLSELEGNHKAKLVDVLMISYDGDESSRVVVNFIFSLGGEDGLILGYDLSAGSGSGWSYGAYCTLKYEGEEVASASW